MKITVAICTRNRAGLLLQTLASLARAIPPARAAWEIIIVDNASTDKTGAAIASFRDRLPIVSVYEPKTGVSHARNAAVDAASGDYMLWTDDDVRVDADWLTVYERAFASYPSAAVFGGAINPLFEGKPPKWLSLTFDLIDTAYATRVLPPVDTPIDSTHWQMPFGANFAVRSIEQRRRRYDPALGRRPGKMLIGGEEIKVVREILRDGAKGWWIPAAKVQHWIPHSRQTLRYLRRYYEGQGWVQFLEQPERDRNQSASGLLREAINAKLRFIRKRPVSPPSTWMPLGVNAWMAWGRFRASLHSKRRT